MHIYDVVILGAGASGLVCAHKAASSGLDTLVLDHADKAGRKLAVTGGGKCNFTNRDIRPGAYAGENPDFCRSALAGFSSTDCIALMDAAGIPFEERDRGEFFCKRPAAEFARYLVERCAFAGCAFVFGEKILAVERNKDAGALGELIVRTTKNTYAARNVVVALGGPSWPQVGATGSGYELARKFGHRIVPIRPALVGLVMEEGWPLAGLQGISLPVNVLVHPVGANGNDASRRSKRPTARNENGGFFAAESLDLLFTHRGVSGPAGLQASVYWSSGKELTVDFLPGADIRALLNEPSSGKLLCRNFVKKHLPDRLADLLCPVEAADSKCASLAKPLREALHANVHSFRMRPVGTEGFTRAEAVAGGVSTDEISSRTMESHRSPGLFFCGEVLDVTGRLGGYNLHWAFASGLAAGKALAEQAGRNDASGSPPHRTFQR